MCCSRPAQSVPLTTAGWEGERRGGRGEGGEGRGERGGGVRLRVSGGDDENSPHYLIACHGSCPPVNVY